MGQAGKLAGWLLALAATATDGAAQPELRIQFAEKVQLDVRAGPVEFDAYGRRFALELESNDRLLAKIPAARKLQLPNAQLMRGKLTGVAHSWVRIARVGDGLEGAIWDGNDLYVVSSAGAIAAALTSPLAAAPGDTVVYRLSDAINALPQGYCGVAASAAMSSNSDVSALTQYKGMVAEIRAASATALMDQLDVALIADRAFQAIEGANASAVMLARLNTVDGIFADQVGVLLVPDEVRLVPQGSDPFTQTAAGDLLRQVSDYRRSDATIRAAGIAHLMTGKDLDGNTLGIAFLDTLCDQQRGVSLGSNAQTSFYSALVMAHELGHNFGADHDGEPGSSCAATPANYLMAPAINGSSSFSQCSLDRIAATVARKRGSCIVSSSYADLVLDAPTTTVLGDVGAPISLPLTVRSIGPLPATAAQVRLSLPYGPQFVSGSVAGGTCSAVGQDVTCALGDLAPGEQRAIDVRLSSSIVLGFTVPVTVSATNDFITSNNQANVQVYARSGVDLAVAIAVNPPEVYVNEAIDFAVDVSALRTQAARGGTLLINAGNFTIQSIDGGGNTCAPLYAGSSLVSCQLKELSPGTQSRVVVHGLAATAGASTATASVSIAGDANSTNDSATASYTIFADADVVLAGSVSNLRQVIGVPFGITYTMTARGRLPSNTVWLQVIAPTGSQVDSVVPGTGGTCIQQNVGVYRCDFGTLNPGDVRTLVATYRMVTSGNDSAIGALRFQDASGEQYRRFDTQIFSALRVDAAVLPASNPATAEGVTGLVTFSMGTRGVELAQNVVATFEVPASVHIQRVVLNTNPDPWQCEVETAQRVRCTGSFVAATSLWVDVFYDSDVPGDYEGILTVSATDDGDLSNNVQRIPIRIQQFLDPSVTGPTQSRNFFVGQAEDFTFTVATGKRPVPGVGIRAASFLPYYDWESMTINGVVCENHDPLQSCPVGDLPANASVPVTVRYKILQSGISGNLGVTVVSPRDFDYSNNSASFAFSIMAKTDVQLSVAQPTATAVGGAKLRLPEIAVRAGTSAANDVVLTVTLPSFVTIEYVSANAICSGTTTIQCSMSQIAAGDSRYFDISLNTSTAGTFTTNVSVQAVNDSDAGNNASTIAISVTAPPTPSPPAPNPPSSPTPPKKSGGGGGFEWLALAFLVAMVIRRAYGPRSARSCAATWALPTCSAAAMAPTSAPRRRGALASAL